MQLPIAPTLSTELAWFVVISIGAILRESKLVRLTNSLKLYMKEGRK